MTQYLAMIAHVFTLVSGEQALKLAQDGKQVFELSCPVSCQSSNPWVGGATVTLGSNYTTVTPGPSIGTCELHELESYKTEPETKLRRKP